MNVKCVEVHVCKNCPKCGEMPHLAREYNKMRDGNIASIMCKKRDYAVVSHYGDGSTLIDAWNKLVESHTDHVMGFMGDGRKLQYRHVV